MIIKFIVKCDREKCEMKEIKYTISYCVCENFSDFLFVTVPVLEP
jgi:hypothetical protein